MSDALDDWAASARAVVAEEIGAVAAERLEPVRVVPVRVVVLREIAGEDDLAQPGRVGREEVRLPDDPSLAMVLAGHDFPRCFTEAARPDALRDRGSSAGLTADEISFARGVAAQWSESSGRDVAWEAAVYEETIAELAGRAGRRVFVGLRGGRVIGWIARPTAWQHAARALGTVVVLGAVYVRVLLSHRLDDPLPFTLMAALVVLPVAWIARARMRVILGGS